jgi:hypothetical protein
MRRRMLASSLIGGFDGWRGLYDTRDRDEGIGGEEGDCIKKIVLAAFVVVYSYNLRWYSNRWLSLRRGVGGLRSSGFS